MSRAIGEAGPALPKPQRQAKSRPERKPRKPLGSNPERQATRYDEHFSGRRDGAIAHDEFIRDCRDAIGLQHRSDTVAAHVIHQGSWRDLVTLTRGHHRQAHNIGLLSFQARYGVNLFGLRHALVVADPGVSPDEQQAAWARLEEEIPDDLLRGHVLQHAWDMAGHKVEPPKCASDVADFWKRGGAVRVKILRFQALGVDRVTIEEVGGGYSWEGETPQRVADLLKDRACACFDAARGGDDGLILGGEALCPE